MKPLNACCIVAFALAVLGCASPPTMITSLEDLTSETQRQGLSDVNQNRILSVTGLLPHAQVGSLYRYKKKRSPSTAIGLAKDTSFFVESLIPAEDPAELQRVKNLVLDARLRARQSLTKLLALSRARISLATAEAAEPPADNLDDLRARLDAAQTAYDTARGQFDMALNAAAKELDKSGLMVIRWDTSTGSKGSLSLGGLFGTSKSKEESTSGFAILSGLRLVTLFVGPDIAQADPPVKKTWKLYNHGFPWIVGSRFPFLGQWHLRDVRITTHLFQAQRVEYLQDVVISEKFEAALEASYDQLSNLDETLKELDEIEINYVREQLSSLSNMGAIANVERRLYPAPFDPELRGRLAVEVETVKSGGDLDHADIEALLPQLDATCLLITGRCLDAQLEEDAQDPARKDSLLSPPTSGWQTIYAVDTDFESLQDLMED